ncbi:MAG: hypothetical protein A2079_05990 [Geobacteraceae bacterium GWC2_48_7]|nr:MAG: hypothetical protein A2079_05990 [Geobacteraceae bacterium GWC2_48_7]
MPPAKQFKGTTVPFILDESINFNTAAMFNPIRCYHSILLFLLLILITNSISKVYEAAVSLISQKK